MMRARDCVDHIRSIACTMENFPIKWISETTRFPTCDHNKSDPNGAKPCSSFDTRSEQRWRNEKVWGMAIAANSWSLAACNTVCQQRARALATLCSLWKTYHCLISQSWGQANTEDALGLSSKYSTPLRGNGRVQLMDRLIACCYHMLCWN